MPHILPLLPAVAAPATGIQIGCFGCGLQWLKVTEGIDTLDCCPADWGDTLVYRVEKRVVQMLTKAVVLQSECNPV